MNSSIGSRPLEECSALKLAQGSGRRSCGRAEVERQRAGDGHQAALCSHLQHKGVLVDLMDVLDLETGLRGDEDLRVCLAFAHCHVQPVLLVITIEDRLPDYRYRCVRSFLLLLYRVANVGE